ncbi:MAG: surface antigen msp4 family protein [Rhodospirillales bacterium]|nr:surface antigen msp4 family protein [Rhodospirillales bacterium]
MRTKLLATAALAGVLGCASPAQAEGIYVGAFGGVGNLEDADLEAGGVDFDFESDTGWLVGAAVGYGFDFGLRTEAEIAYRMNDLDEGSVAGVDFGVDGDTTALSFMGNLWFDVPVAWAVRPFIGAGAGMAQVSLNDAEAGAGEIADDSDWVFAYQLGAGLGYRLNPTLDLTAEYRYFATDDPELEAFGIDADYEYASHSVLFGVRYSFQ